jgi:hypothetical protein
MPKTGYGQRASTHINRRATQNAFRAFDYAPVIARPLNTYVVINLRESPAENAVTLFNEIRHKFRDWLNYKTKATTAGAMRPVYVASHENPNDDLPHVNWALHVPPEFLPEFYKKLRGWVEKVQGTVGPYDIRVQPIDPKRAKRLAKYILKGTDPAFTDHFHLGELVAEHGPQGTVWGRRLSVSSAISAAARKEAGWRPQHRVRRGGRSGDARGAIISP